MKSSQLVFVCSFVINKRITLLFSLLDLGMNVTRKDISLTHLAYVMLHAQKERSDCLCNVLRRLSSQLRLCVRVCEQIGCRTITLRPQFFTDFHHILCAAQKYGWFDANCS